VLLFFELPQAASPMVNASAATAVAARPRPGREITITSPRGYEFYQPVG
jgi:hypothetical protein